MENINNPFWNNVITYFHSFNKTYEITTEQEIEAFSFLHNPKIRIGGKAIYTESKMK